MSTPSATLCYHLAAALPQHICAKPSVTVYCHATDSPVPLSPAILHANMRAIAECWTVARYRGRASISYNICENILDIKYGGSSSLGLPMYGIQTPGRDYGSPVINSNVNELVAKYYSVVDLIKDKLDGSFGSIVTIGGSSTDDTPLLGEIMEKTQDKWSKSHRMMAPEGSDIKSVSSSLADSQYILQPFQDAIAAEIGCPKWLIFPTITTSQYEMETRECWAKQQFALFVQHILASLLDKQGFTVLTIDPPSYRCEQYNSLVQNTAADTEMKLSTVRLNNQKIRSIAQQQVDNLPNRGGIMANNGVTLADAAAGVDQS